MPALGLVRARAARDVFAAAGIHGIYHDSRVEGWLFTRRKPSRVSASWSARCASRHSIHRTQGRASSQVIVSIVAMGVNATRATAPLTVPKVTHSVSPIGWVCRQFRCRRKCQGQKNGAGCAPAPKVTRPKRGGTFKARVVMTSRTTPAPRRRCSEMPLALGVSAGVDSCRRSNIRATVVLG